MRLLPIAATLAFFILQSDLIFCSSEPLDEFSSDVNSTESDYDEAYQEIISEAAMKAVMEMLEQEQIDMEADEDDGAFRLQESLIPSSDQEPSTDSENSQGSDSKSRRRRAMPFGQVPPKLELPPLFRPGPQAMGPQSAGCPAPIPSVDPFIRYANMLQDVMRRDHEKLIYQQTFINRILEVLSSAIRPSELGNQLIGAAQYFSKVQSLGTVIVDNIKSITNTFYHDPSSKDGQPLNLNEVHTNLQRLQAIVEELKKLMNYLKQMTSEIVYRRLAPNSPPQVITAKKTFYGSVNLPQVVSTSSMLTIDQIGPNKVQPVLSTVYRPSSMANVKLRGNKTIGGNVLIQGNLNAHVINGINFNDQAVLKSSSGSQQITSPVQFNAPLSIDQMTTVNGINHIGDIGEELIYLNENRNIVINSSKTFTQNIVRIGNLDASFIDGVDCRRLLDNGLRATGDQVIPGTLVFSPQSTVELPAATHIINGTINGVDVASFIKDVVRVDQQATIIANKQFLLDNLTINSDMVINGRLNGLRLPLDVVNQKSPSQIITAQKKFLNPLTFGHARVTGLVSGLRLPEDVVALSTTGSNDVPIAGVTIMANDAYANNVNAAGSIDGVDLNSVVPQLLTINDQQILGRNTFAGPVIVKNDMNVEGLINDVHWPLLANDTIFKSDSQATIIATKHFASELHAKELLIEDSLNGQHLSTCCVPASLKLNSVILPAINFQGPTVFGDISVKGNFDSIDLVDLYRNRISLSEPQTILARINYADRLAIQNLALINGSRINGVNLVHDIVWKSMDNQVITASKTFQRSFFANQLTINDQLVQTKSGLIDGVNLAAINNRRVTLNTNQVLVAPLELGGQNSVREMNISGTINGHKLNDFLRDIMFKSVPQVVTGQKQFTSPVNVYGDIMAQQGLNGHNLAQINANAVKLHGLAKFERPVTFKSPLRIRGSLFVNGLINGIVNVSNIVADSVYLNPSSPSVQTISSPMTVFNKQIVVNGDLNIETSVNGMNMMEDVLLRDVPQVIRGKMQFSRTLTILNNTSVKDKINGISLEDFERSTMRINVPSEVRSPLEFSQQLNILAGGSLPVNGRVNGIKLSQTAADTLVNEIDPNGPYSDSLVTGAKVLVSPSRFGGSIISESLNGLNAINLAHDIVLINSSQPQVITAPKQMISGQMVQVRGNLVTGPSTKMHIKNYGPLNGIDLRRLIALSAKLNEPAKFVAPMEFVDSLNWQAPDNKILNSGSINGVNLDKDLIHLHRDQVIPSRKSFASVASLNHVPVNGTVNDHHLPSLAKGTLTSGTNQKILGHKVILKPVELMGGNNLVSNLNGLNVNVDFVTLSGNDLIYGQWQFKNPGMAVYVKANLNVHGLINGRNLSQLAAGALYKDIPIAIRRPIRLQKAQFLQPLNLINGTVNGIDLNKLNADLDMFMGTTNRSKAALGHSLVSIDQASGQLLAAFESGCQMLDKIVLYQIMDGIFGDAIQPVDSTTLSVIQTNRSNAQVATSSLIRFDQYEQLFVYAGGQPLESVTLSTFSINGYIFRIVRVLPTNEYRLISLKDGRWMLIGVNLKYIDAVVVNRWTSYDRSSRVEIGVITRIEQNSVISMGILEYQRDAEPTLQWFPYNLSNGVDPNKVIVLTNDDYTADLEILIAIVNNRDPTSCGQLSHGSVILYHWNPQRSQFVLFQQLFEPQEISDAVGFASHGTNYIVLANARGNTVYVYRRPQNEYGESCRPFELSEQLFMPRTSKLTTFELGAQFAEPLERYLVTVNGTHLAIWLEHGHSGFNYNYNAWTIKVNSVAAVRLVKQNHEIFLVVSQSKGHCIGTFIYKLQMKGISSARLQLRTPLIS